jgi:stage V sporulation protein G
MEITEVRIRLVQGNDPHLQAFCSITLDDMFVIRDLKIIKGAKGLFVVMPSRKLTDPCPRCGWKNHLRSRFCNRCGKGLDPDRTIRAIRDVDGDARLHASVAHPINDACRRTIEARVLAAYAAERDQSEHDGVCVTLPLAVGSCRRQQPAR